MPRYEPGYASGRFDPHDIDHLVLGGIVLVSESPLSTRLGSHNNNSCMLLLANTSECRTAGRVEFEEAMENGSHMSVLALENKGHSA